MVDPADMLLNRGLVPFQPRPDLLGGQVNVVKGMRSEALHPDLTRRRIGGVQVDGRVSNSRNYLKRNEVVIVVPVMWNGRDRSVMIEFLSPLASGYEPRTDRRSSDPNGVSVD